MSFMTCKVSFPLILSLILLPCLSVVLNRYFTKASFFAAGLDPQLFSCSVPT